MQGQQAQIQAQMAQQMTTATGLYGNAIQNNLSSSPGSWTVSASSNATAEPKLTDSYVKKLKDKLGL